MKPTPKSAAAFVLLLATTVSFASASCAKTEEAAVPAGSANPDAALPDDDAGTEIDASIEAGPRTCSDHGLCPTALPGEPTLKGVWADGTGAAWAVSEEGDVLRWDGSAWTVHASGFGALNAIWGSSPTDVWVAGVRGIVHGTGASSATLTFAPSTLPDPKTSIWSIWGTSAQDVWAVGFTQADGGDTPPRVLHFAPGGAGPGWTIDPASNEGIAFTHVWGSPGTGVWIAGTRPSADDPFFTEVAVLRKNGSGAFVPETLPDDPEDILPWARMQTIQGAVAASDTSVWVFGRTSFPGIWRGTSTDGGKTFSWALTRDGRPDEPMLTALHGVGDDVWAVGEYGRVRHWNGASWSPVAITTTKLPVTDPFYAVFSRGAAEAWTVGKGIALRYDPAQEKDGGLP